MRQEGGRAPRKNYASTLLNLSWWEKVARPFPQPQIDTLAGEPSADWAGCV
jgi:hypothetical protein